MMHRPTGPTLARMEREARTRVETALALTAKVAKLRTAVERALLMRAVRPTAPLRQTVRLLWLQLRLKLAERSLTRELRAKTESLARLREAKRLIRSTTRSRMR